MERRHDVGETVTELCAAVEKTICVPFYEDNIQTLQKITNEFFRDLKIPVYQQAINLIVARVALDEHTESQSMYLEEIDTDCGVFFEHNDDLNTNISHYLKTQDITNRLDTSEKKYQSTGVKREVKDYFTNLVANNNQLRDRITNYYQVDTDLIQSVKYYKQQGNE